MRDRPFNKWSWGTRVCAWRRMKPDLYLSPRTKIHSKRIKDLNIRPETLKLLRKIFQDMDISRDFLKMDSNRTEKNSKNWKAGLHKTKKFLHSKRNNHQRKEVAYRQKKKSLLTEHQAGVNIETT